MAPVCVCENADVDITIMSKTRAKRNVRPLTRVIEVLLKLFSKRPRLKGGWLGKSHRYEACGGLYRGCIQKLAVILQPIDNPRNEKVPTKKLDFQIRELIGLLVHLSEGGSK